MNTLSPARARRNAARLSSVSSYLQSVRQYFAELRRQPLAWEKRVREEAQVAYEADRSTAAENAQLVAQLASRLGWSPERVQAEALFRLFVAVDGGDLGTLCAGQERPLSFHIEEQRKVLEEIADGTFERKSARRLKIRRAA